MPAKKKTAETSRGRSKSASRATSKSRARSRSRTRSRSKTPTRAPKSDSKTKRRHSSSSSSDESVAHHRSKATVRRSSDSGSRTARSSSRNAVSSKMQLIVKKIEHESSPAEKSFTKSSQSQISCCPMLDSFFKSPWFTALMIICKLLFLIPFVYWINLMVFTPAQASKGGEQGEKKVETTMWGPSYSYLWVLWPTDWQVYFDGYVFGLVLVYMIVNFLLLRFLPIGRLVSTTGSRRGDFRCSGPACAIIILALFAGLEFTEWAKVKGLKPSTFLPKYWLSLLTSFLICELLIGLIACYLSRKYGRSTRQSTVSVSGSVLSEFYYGRLSRPQWFGLEWKVTVMQISILSLLLVTYTYAASQWETQGRLSPAFCFVVVMQTIWAFRFFCCWHFYLSSFDSRDVGFGYSLLLERFSMPFLNTMTSLYLFLHPEAGRFADSASPHSCNYYTLGVGTVLYLAGTYIALSSDMIKGKFWLDPHHPSVSKLDTIAGSGTQRLIVSGMWGQIRHPNYLGELMAAIALSIPCGFDSYIPWFYPVLLFLILMSRLCLIEHRCAKKYGPLWQKYKAMVPYRLIPKIF